MTREEIRARLDNGESLDCIRDMVIDELDDVFEEYIKNQIRKESIDAEKLTATRKRLAIAAIDYINALRVDDYKLSSQFIESITGNLKDHESMFREVIQQYSDDLDWAQKLFTSEKTYKFLANIFHL